MQLGTEKAYLMLLIQILLKIELKNIPQKYLDQRLHQALDSIVDDLSNKIAPTDGPIDFSQMYPMELYTNTNDPTNPLYRRGQGVDIHKQIGKLPRPQAGYTPGRYKYMRPYNPLDQQL